jgi:uncharacterized membrane protein
MAMIDSVDDYLTQLKSELAGSDLATIQDALSDAEEYLRTALASAQQSHPETNEAAALPAIVDEFGSPEEIAAAYRQIEARIQPTLNHAAQPSSNRSPAARFFGILADGRAWGALLYMLFALVTGILYFTWAVTGLSLTAGLIVLIIGVPFFGLFLLSVRGIALVEGRIVEALLGVRMPRRPVFVDKNLGWWGRFKVLLTSRHTWMSILYMILQLPLGIIYFTLFITLLSISLALIAAPVAQVIFNFPPITINSMHVYLSFPQLLFAALGGILLVFATMHLAKIVGRLHGLMAKAMLVS